MKGVINMYGYGYGCGGYGGYGGGCGGEWIWIIIIVFIAFFLIGNNRVCGCQCHQQNCR